MECDVIIVGGGPAGLTAAYELIQYNLSVCVLEADPDDVGGLAKTKSYALGRIDLGYHALASDDVEIMQLWQHVLGQDLLVKSSSRSYYFKQKFYQAPYKLIRALNRFGWWRALRAIFSSWRTHRQTKVPQHFQHKLIRQYGQYFYQLYLQAFTLKIWGKPADHLTVDTPTASIFHPFIFKALRQRFHPKKIIGDTFLYPRLGMGMLWQSVAEAISQKGGEVVMDAAVYRLEFQNNLWQVSYRQQNGDASRCHARFVIHTVPIKHLVLQYLAPTPSQKLIAAAKNLQYRSLIVVALFIQGESGLQDNALEVQDAAYQIARVTNYKNKSLQMVNDETLTNLGCEFYCQYQDALWQHSDAQLIRLAVEEVCRLQLVQAENIIEGRVIRQAQAYPIMDAAAQASKAYIHSILAKHYPTLYAAGSMGTHTVLDQPQAMQSGLIAANNVLHGMGKNVKKHTDQVQAVTDLIKKMSREAGLSEYS